MNTNNTLQKVLFESKHLALCLLDKSGNVVAVNSTFQNQLCQEEIDTSKPISIRSLSFWNKDLIALDTAWKEFLENGAASFNSYLYYREELLFHEVELKQANDEGGVLMEFFKKQEHTKAEKESTRTDGELDKMAAIISHDLRGPVSNIAYLLSIFDGGVADKEELEEFMDALKKSNAKTLDIIDEMGALINPKLKRRSHSAPSLQPLICSILENFEEEISQTQARVVIDIQDHSDWKVPKGAFVMILKQVVSNSLKYRKEDETPKIVITCSRKNGDRIIEVKDNGLGFDVVENEQHLFGLFQTFHNRPDSRGIGLFQVKNRLLSIGGAISLKSQEGIGTTVTLNFKQNELEEAPLYN
ncbi:sensor histidine kinase [Owenweeksia hongkongensis]|uniref:sensor histidine kinase n=1 Tax=Owenweeksia hongkongensis TaxID=253245 RepID=UPI003A8EA5EC